MTRLAGEWAAQHYCARTYVIRTCGLYGVGGATTRAGNFVETMLRLARAGKPIRVVDDQVLTPTSTVDVARALLQLVPAAPFGIYHLTNTGQCSWYEFARELFRLFDLSPDLSPTTSAEFNSLAMRPPYSVLDNARLRSACIADLRDWHEALADYARQVSGVSSEESGR
jgi:dTDP-4-dehydrorhamnose reductase